MTAEEVTLLLTLQDRASAGVTAFQAKVEKLGLAGAVATSGLAGIGRAAEALASKASAGIDRLVSKTMHLAKWAAVAGAGFAAWEIKSGVQLNAQVETFTKSLERLTGSASRGREMTRSALAAAGTSPFALTDILEATQALTAMGADAGRWLKPLQDVAAGTRKSILDVVGAFRGFYLGGEGNRALSQMGFSASGISGKPEDKGRDLERLAAMIQSRYGGMTEAVAGTFAGMLQQLRNQWSAFLISATGPLFERISSDLRRLLDWAGGGLDRLAARISGPLVRAWDVASAAAARFFQTVESRGWGKTFEGLWQSMKPFVVQAAEMLGKLFWEAFKLTLSAAAGGNVGAMGVLAYGAGKLGAGALINQSVRSGWDKLFGAAGQAGTMAAGSATGTGGALAIANALRASQSMGGAAAGPPIEHLLAGAGGGAAVRGAGAASVASLALPVTLAALAALGITTAIYSQIRHGTWYATFENWGAPAGEWWARDAKADAAEQEAMAIIARTRALRAERLAGTAGGFAGRLAAESAAQRALPDTVAGMRGGFESALAEKVRAAGLQGAGSEEKIAAWGDDLKRLTAELGTLDALRAKAASEIAETYRKQLDVLARQSDVLLTIAGEMDAMREKALGKTTGLLLMGPTERAKFMREEDWIKSLSPAELEAATASKRGREIFGKHDVRELLPEDAIARWGRYAGLPELPTSGADARKQAEATIAEAAKAKEKAALAAVPAVQQAFAQVEVARIQVDLKGFSPEEIAPALAKALAEARPQMIESFRKIIAEMIAAENEKISRAQMSGEQS